MCKYLLIALLVTGLAGCRSEMPVSSNKPPKDQVIATDKYKAWRVINPASVPDQLSHEQLPRKYQVLTLDINRVKMRLRDLEQKKKVPDQFRYEKTGQDHILLQLPWNDGQFHTFLVKNSNVFSPELAKKFPNIRSYSGEKEDDGSTHLRLDINPSGLFAMITAPSQTLFIRPLNEEGRFYLCYDKSDVERENKEFYEPPIKTRGNE